MKKRSFPEGSEAQLMIWRDGTCRRHSPWSSGRAMSASVSDTGPSILGPSLRIRTNSSAARHTQSTGDQRHQA